MINLNEMQEKIVKHTEGPVMVLAGAGSGKTRVLTERISYILENNLAHPYEILAITFTNKAANEIKQRLVEKNEGASFVWAMTFHSMCCRILRSEAHYLDGYNSNFSIYDEQDKKSVIKKILKDDNLTDGDYLEEVSKQLSSYKMSNMSLDEYQNLSCYSPNNKIIFSVIKKYEEKMKSDNAMDFDDLINKTLFLLKNEPAVRDKYQQQFRYILVDEFQDTNETQYELVKILGGYHKNVFAVGDEDQSIYSWRGACVGNIKKFLSDFDDAKLYKLEQNYRSTKTIINYANTIIKNNKNRIDKTLFTNNETGATVVYNKSETDREEADFVTRTILGLVRDKGYNYKDIAVLMRLNALSRNFEAKFADYNVPYRIFGGLKFYERAEIKNILAYLKLLINHKDEESFSRIINYPKRGIGDGAIEKLKEIANGNCMFDTILSIPDDSQGNLAKFIPFKHLMNDFIQKKDSLTLLDFVRYVIDQAGLKTIYTNETDEEINRKMNIDEFIHNVDEYSRENEDKTLVDFLHTISLTTDIDNYEETNNQVTLATVHSVKGLEFKVVFIIGLEEKYFPISRMDSTEDDMEEERRLMYVAITRARERLFLCCSHSRYMYGKQMYSKVSRFIKELGYEKEVESRFVRQEDTNSSALSSNRFHHTAFNGSLNTFMHQNIVDAHKSENFAIGDRVFHPKFGVGYITNLEKQTNTATINFDNFGNKVLSLQFAPIKKM